jgi:uncharacterized tellurite resistance protein B-like protein
MSDMYEALRRKLFDCGGASTRHPADPVLASEELMMHVAQLDRRVSQLAADWQQERNGFDSARRAQIQMQAADMSAQILQLQRVCGTHARRLEGVLQQVSRDLGELQRGSRYLASIRPVKTNFPKFVDSKG